MRRAVWNGLVLAMAALAIYVAYVTMRIEQQSTRDEAQPADVILVLGAAEYRGRPSPCCARASTMPWISTAASWPRGS